MRILFAILLLLATTACGGAPPSIEACAPPRPVLVVIDPASIRAHSPSFILTAQGNNFIPASVVFFDSRALPTTYVSSQQLRAQVSLDYLRNPGTVPVDVFNPRDVTNCTLGQAGLSRASNALNFTILP